MWDDHHGLESKTPSPNWREKDQCELCHLRGRLGSTRLSNCAES